MLDRQNVLELIGKYSHRYSSCVITCFSFDFCFFEERVMSVLRQADIKNVNVFIDGKYLEESQEKASGFEFSTHRTYSINPIYERGVFHPKIMLLTGPKHGLVIIGSGNLTSSGLSSNDEVWGAFHLDNVESKNAPVFAEIWQYLQSYLDQAKGFNKQKIDWVLQQSPWLKDIEKSMSSDFIPIDASQELKFVANTAKSSHYDELVKYLPQGEVEQLTIVSPYFDKAGKLLEQLAEQYDINNFRCITDTEFGLLPYALNDSLKESIAFYNWKAVMNGKGDEIHRLHAKIFHFKYKDGREYLYIGSANATLAAFGSEQKNPVNAEAGLLLRREGGNYLRELGISTESCRPFDLPEFHARKENRGDIPPTVRYKNRIVYAEINGLSLGVYLKQSAKSTMCIQVSDNNETIVDVVSLEAGNSTYVVDLKNSVKAKRVCLTIDGERVSNYAIIHYVALQAKCNPDPTQAKLNDLIANVAIDPENSYFYELLSHVDYQWVDDDLNERKTVRTQSFQDNNSKDEVVHQQMSEDEFNDLSSKQAYEASILNNSSVQIAEVLSLISRGLLTKKDHVQESVEEQLAGIDINEHDGSGEVVAQVRNDRMLYEKERRAIANHIAKVDKYFSEGLKHMYSTKTQQDSPHLTINHRTLSNTSTFVDLLFLYYNKTYTLQTTQIAIVYNPRVLEEIKKIEKKYDLKSLEKVDKDRTSIKYYELEANQFVAVKSAFDKLDSKLLLAQQELIVSPRKTQYFAEGFIKENKGSGLKSYLVSVLGKFLIHTNAKTGYKDYSNYQLVNDKMNNFRKDIFDKATFLILNLYWSKKETPLRDILLLDLLQLVYPKSIREEDILTIEESLRLLYTNPYYNGKRHDEELNSYVSIFLPQFICWQENYNDDSRRKGLINTLNQVAYGSYVYSKSLGFSCIESVGKGKIELVKPGFDWNKSSNAYSCVFKTNQTKIISYG